jgi:hypothetical protein
MTLIAEALAERKDIIKRVKEFPSKLAEMAVWDEDEDKPNRTEIETYVVGTREDLDRLQDLNVAINKANNEMLVKTELGEMTIMEAIALRDRLNIERSIKSGAASNIESTLGRDDRRWGQRRTKDDVKRDTLVAPREMTREEDALAGQIRRLDLAIQQVNWTQELPE